MKKLSLLIALSCLCQATFAQLNVSGTHIKMADVIANYKRNFAPFMNNSKDPDFKLPGIKNTAFSEKLENKDYHLDRWKYYWVNHTDGNGYLMGPAKTFNAWKAYQSSLATHRVTASGGGSNWVFQGDDSSGADGSGVGRINVVAFHPTDANTYWIGSPGGGAWKTTNNGASWTCMTDQLPLLSMSDIKFNPQNPNTIYLCTGDRDGDDYYSIGVLKSYDGGTTWNTTGMTYGESQFHLSNALLVNPLDTNSLIYSSDTGIFRSFDGGNTWIGPSVLGDFKQLVYCPNDTNIVYATSHAGIPSPSSLAQIYRSADGGMTWRQITNFTDAYRITLAVTPANPAIVKAIVAASDATNMFGLYGIFNSTDTGKTFTQIFTPADCSSGTQNLLSFNPDGSGCGGQGFYDLTLAISPTNANLVYCGGVNGWQSTDGGTTWQIMDQWANYIPGVIAIHADKHFMGFHPLVPGRFFETNDGGIYWSDNPTSTGVWNDVTNGLGITEFYRVAVSNLATYEIAGAQDVGTKLVQNFSYMDADGGDGMECQLDPLDSNTAYASSEYGYIDLLSSVLPTGNISGNIPGAPSGGWVTPYIIEPTCHSCLLAGYQDVYKTTDYGTTWNDISGSLTAGDLLRVYTTQTDSNVIYAMDDPTATGTTNIYYTTTGGSPWNTITAPYPGQAMTDMVVDPTNPNNMWVSWGGYASQGSPQVVNYNVTTNTWTSFNAGLPDAPVDCIKMDLENMTMYVGTEIGVFYRDSTMADWAAFNTGLPTVGVYDLQFDYTTNMVWAATFGRSLWASPRHLLPTGVAKVNAAVAAMVVTPNPSHGTFGISLGAYAKAGALNCSVLDQKGNVAWSGVVNYTPGNPFTVKTSGLATGSYIIEVASGTTIVGKEKLVIE